MGVALTDKGKAPLVHEAAVCRYSGIGDVVVFADGNGA